MSAIWNYYLAHETTVTLAAFWILSAAIGSLPMPTDKSSMFYDWFFKFANTVGANLSRAGAAFGPKLPPPPSPQK